MRLYIISLLLLSTVAAHAEVYRWTGSDGKVHYSDKKPAEKAEDISDKVKQQNIDTSTAEHQKMESIFRKENEADREYKEQKPQRSLEQIQYCIHLKDYLNTISGRVQFIDDNGKPVAVTLDEQKKRVAETKKLIQEKCPE